MRLSLHALLSLSLALVPPPPAWANPMDPARQAVQASHEEAKGRALRAVQNDLAHSLSEVIRETAKDQAPVLTELSQALFTEQSQLISGFDRLAELDAPSISAIREEVQRSFDQYKDFVRRRFDASFRMAEFRYEAQRSLIFASMALARFERRCESGAGLGGANSHLPLHPDLPPVAFNVFVGTDSNGAYSIDANYSGTGSAAEKARSTLIGTTSTMLTISTNIAINGSAGATTAFYQAALPYMWGAGVAIIVISLYQGQIERVKAENDIAEARVYAFANTANDQDTASYYREHCLAYASGVRLLRETLEQALRNPNGLESLAAKMGDIDQEMRNLLAISQIRAKILEEIKILSEKYHQLPKGEEQERVQGELNDKLAHLKQAGDQLSTAGTPEKVAALVAKILLTREHEIKSTMSSLTWQAVELSQRRAYMNILAILKLSTQRNFAKYLGDGSALSQELRILEGFERARGTFKSFLAAKIQNIFGRISREELLSLAKSLNDQKESLVRRYGDRPEIFEFALEVNALLAGV